MSSNQYTTRIGDNHIWTTKGDKVALAHPDHIDDIVDKLNLSEDDFLTDNDRDIINWCAANNVDDEEALNKLQQEAVKHEANEEHFMELYDIVYKMSKLENWRDEEKELIEEMKDLLERIDVKKDKPEPKPEKKSSKKLAAVKEVVVEKEVIPKALRLKIDTAITYLQQAMNDIPAKG